MDTKVSKRSFLEHGECCCESVRSAVEVIGEFGCA